MAKRHILELHDLGPLFFQFIRLSKGTPLVHKGTTVEIEHPFRICRNSLIVRLPGRWAVVLGIFRATVEDEDEAMRMAIQAVDSQILDESGHLLEHFEQSQETAARTQVARHSTDPDDEWQLLDTLGLQ